MKLLDGLTKKAIVTESSLRSMSLTGLNDIKSTVTQLSAVHNDIKNSIKNGVSITTEEATKLFKDALNTINKTNIELDKENTKIKDTIQHEKNKIKLLEEEVKLREKQTNQALSTFDKIKQQDALALKNTHEINKQLIIQRNLNKTNLNDVIEKAKYELQTKRDILAYEIKEGLVQKGSLDYLQRKNQILKEEIALKAKSSAIATSSTTSDKTKTNA
jgi:uncharacterized protein YdiU (UPF0061 family)